MISLGKRGSCQPNSLVFLFINALMAEFQNAAGKHAAKPPGNHVNQFKLIFVSKSRDFASTTDGTWDVYYSC